MVRQGRQVHYAKPAKGQGPQPKAGRHNVVVVIVIVVVVVVVLAQAVAVY